MSAVHVQNASPIIVERLVECSEPRSRCPPVHPRTVECTQVNRHYGDSLNCRAESIIQQSEYAVSRKYNGRDKYLERLMHFLTQGNWYESRCTHFDCFFTPVCPFCVFFCRRLSATFHCAEASAVLTSTVASLVKQRYGGANPTLRDDDAFWRRDLHTLRHAELSHLASLVRAGVQKPGKG